MELRRTLKFNSFQYFEDALITDNGFREYDFRWLLGEEINPNGFLLLGKAYGTFAKNELKETKVVVGHDFRSYSQELCRSFILGLLSTGAHVVDIGLCLTPMIYNSQYHFKTKAGAMVTASHNENGWTGLKLADGYSSTFLPDAVKQFKELLFSGKFVTGSGQYEEQQNYLHHYLKDVVDDFNLIKPVKAVLATGNGTAGKFAPPILNALGCDLVELHCDGDWTFPHFNPNPENIAFLKKIGETTVENGCALGIGIDGDGDRIGVVDNRGEEVFSDKLGLLLARWLCKDHPGRDIVIDVKSTGLYATDEELKKAKANIVTWKTGHSYIKNKVSVNNAIAGFEKSGHFFFNPPFGRGYDDAVLSAVLLLKFLSEKDKSLRELIEALPKSWQSPTFGVYCKDEEKYDVVEEIKNQYEMAYRNAKPVIGSEIKELISINGVRFVFENGSWGLLRASSNKPSLVVVAESNKSEEELNSILSDIRKRLIATGKTGEYDQ